MVLVHCGDRAFTGIEAIVFDKDGTLADSQDFLRTLAQRRARLLDAQVPGVQEPLLMAFGVEGSSLDPQGLMAVGTRYENEVAAAAYVAETGKAWAAALALVSQVFTDADTYAGSKAELTPPYPGTSAMLARLSTSLKLAVLSSDSTAHVSAFLSHYHLSEHIALAQGSDPGGLSKPDPELLHRLCRQLGVAPAATLVVGDSDLDAQLAGAAQAAGFIRAAWADSRPLGAAADATLTHWEALQVQS